MGTVKALGKSKQISKSSPPAVRGGNGHMTGNKVGTQTPGQTSTKGVNTGGKFAKGGTGKMTRMAVSAAPAGRTGR